MKRKQIDEETTSTSACKKVKEEPNDVEGDIEEWKREFYRIDDEILVLERRRQDILNKLKEDSRTSISFSNVKRYEKTKECLNSLVFLSISSDCMRIIFDFAFSGRLLSPIFVNALCRMTTSMREAMLNCNFILDLSQGKYNLNATKTPPFKTIGVEIIPNSTNMKVLEQMSALGIILESVTVRQDLFRTHSFASKVLENTKKLVWIQGNDATNLVDFSGDSLEKICLVSFKQLHLARGKLWKHAIVAYPLVGFSDLSLFMDRSEHLTFFNAHCKPAGGDISVARVLEAMKRSKTIKKVVFVQYVSKKKDPVFSKETNILIHVFSKKFDEISKIASHGTSSVPLDYMKLMKTELDYEFDVDNDEVFAKQYVTFLSKGLCKSTLTSIML